RSKRTVCEPSGCVESTRDCVEPMASNEFCCELRSEQTQCVASTTGIPIRRHCHRNKIARINHANESRHLFTTKRDLFRTPRFEHFSRTKNLLHENAHFGTYDFDVEGRFWSYKAVDWDPLKVHQETGVALCTLNCLFERFSEHERENRAFRRAK